MKLFHFPVWVRCYKLCFNLDLLKLYSMLRVQLNQTWIRKSQKHITTHMKYVIKEGQSKNVKFSVTIILELLEFDFNLKKNKYKTWCQVRNYDQGNVNKVTTDDCKQILPPTVSHIIFFTIHSSFRYWKWTLTLFGPLFPDALRSPGQTSVATPRSREIACARCQQRCSLLYIHITMAFNLTSKLFD